MNINAAFSSNYLRSVDIKGKDVSVVISEFTMETVGQGNDAKELPVLKFKGKDAGFVLNKTNSSIIQKSFGDETDDWIGRTIELFVTDVTYKGEVVDGIRVKVPQQGERKDEPLDLDKDGDPDVPF